MTLDEIKEAIRQYPTPISGCDAQYTWLLQERLRLTNPDSDYEIVDRVNNDHIHNVQIA